MATAELSQYVFPPLARIIDEYRREVLFHVITPSRYSQGPSVEMWIVLDPETANLYMKMFKKPYRTLEIFTDLDMIDDFYTRHPTGVYYVNRSPGGLTALDILFACS